MLDLAKAVNVESLVVGALALATLLCLLPMLAILIP